MKLSRLLSVLRLPCPADVEITSLACDSREVAPGALFAALPGAREDGRAHIGEAVRKGAAAVLCAPPLPEGIPAVAVDDPRAALGPLAAQFYGWPARQMTMLAVTGTKGKTTTAHMLRAILTEAGCRCGMIGTLGSFAGGDLIAPAANTTPEPIALHRTLRQMADARCTHVVMEVSSQAMKLHRVEGIDFAAGLFLNLAPDHIGPYEHASFDEYRACKAALFRRCRVAVGNLADPSWPAMRAQLPPGAPALTFGMCPGADVRGALLPPEGLVSRLSVAGSPEPYAVSMPGAFNAANADPALPRPRPLRRPHRLRPQRRVLPRPALRPPAPRHGPDHRRVRRGRGPAPHPPDGYGPGRRGVRRQRRPHRGQSPVRGPRRHLRPDRRRHGGRHPPHHRPGPPGGHLHRPGYGPPRRPGGPAGQGPRGLH